MSQLHEEAPQRERMIAEAAYFRAERRGFVGGDPLTDWLEAEAEISARLSSQGKSRARARTAQAVRKKPAGAAGQPRKPRRT